MLEILISSHKIVGTLKLIYYHVPLLYYALGYKIGSNNLVYNYVITYIAVTKFIILRTTY